MAMNIKIKRNPFNKIYKDLNRPFVLYLWYDNEEVSPKQLKSFMLDWESSLNWKQKKKNRIYKCK